MTEVTEADTSAGVDMLASLGISLNPVTTEDDDSEVDVASVPLPQVEAVVVSPPEFSVPRQILVSMLEQVLMVVPTRDFVAALKNVVLDVEPGRLTITGSDSTSTIISTKSAVRVENPGRVLIGAQKLFNVVKRCAGSSVHLRTEDQQLHISSGASSWSLRIAPSQDYAKLAELGDLVWHTVSRKDFVRAVTATRYAAGSDDNDPARMQLDIHQGTVTATDKQVFAQARGMLPAELTCEVSTTAVDLLIKMLDRNDAAEFRLANDQFHIVAEIGPVEAPDRLVSVHVQEQFPPESRNVFMTPVSENRDMLTVDAGMLVEALGRAVPTSDEETSAVALQAGVPDSEHVTVATRNRYAEVSTEKVPGTFVRLNSEKLPDPRTVQLNHQRLTQAVRAAGLADPEVTGSDGAGVVQLLLGVDRSKRRPAFVVVQDGCSEGEQVSVQAVLTQVRSEWMA